LAKEAIKYESEVLNYLQNNYSREQLSRIKVIQLNNESKNGFGDNEIVTDEAYDVESVSNVIDNFPEFSDVKFLFNSAGFYDINSIESLFQKLKTKYPNIQLDLGIDDYGNDVGDVDFPIIGDIDPEELPVLGHVDPLFYDTLLNNDFKRAEDDQTKIGFQEEITELQVEPWDGNAKLPGNPVDDFQYSLERGIEILNSDKEQTKLSNNEIKIGIWGLEYLMQNKNGPDNKKILEEIKDINTK